MNARCLGGPLDGKVKPWVGRRLAVSQWHNLPVLFDQARDPLESLYYVYYNRALSFDGEPLWLCDEA